MLQILLRGLQSSVSNRERDTVITIISSVQNAHVEFVNALQHYLTATEDMTERDALLLAFGVLASTAQDNVEVVITDFLLQQLTSVDDNDTSNLIHLVLAMGNTGSKYVVDTILTYLHHSSKDVRSASIGALLKFTHLEEVQDSLEAVLELYPDEETVSIVTQTLIKGYTYSEMMEIEVEVKSSHSILHTLIAAVLNTNDTELMKQVVIYVRKVGGEGASVLLGQLHARLRRGTDWDEHNSDYDCVASQSSRAADVSSYPRHRAYIYGNRIGANEINMQVGMGAFIGISNDCNNMKVFVRACARANVFDESRDLAEIEFKVEKLAASISGRAYTQFGGNTLLNYQRSVSASYCFTYDHNLFRYRGRLFKFSYYIFVYVGYIEVSISLYLGLSIDLDAEMCASANLNELLTATTGIVPRVTLTIEGTASFTFIVSYYI